jgi:hypothetical protein
MEESPAQSRDAWKRQRFEKIYKEREDKPAILLERPRAHYVRVSEVTIDDWGVKLVITCLPAPGFDLLGRSKKHTSQFAAAWMTFSATSDEWQAMYVGWRLYFDPAVIKVTLETAAELAKDGKVLDYQGARIAMAEIELAKEQAGLDKFNKLFGTTT